MQRKRHLFTDTEIQEAYAQAGSLSGLADTLDITYPTAAAWVADLGISKPQGYNRPGHPIKGRECRHAREYLGMIRDQFCGLSGVSKTALRQFELGKQDVRKTSMDKIMKVFDNEGIFFNGDGTFQSAGHQGV